MNQKNQFTTKPSKKTMRHVLLSLAVVFVITTLFIGTGSAIVNNQNIFTYEVVEGLSAGEWKNGDISISAVVIDENHGYFPESSNFVEGTYTNDTFSINIKHPSANIEGIGKDDLYPNGYIVANGGLLIIGNPITLTPYSLSDNVKVVKLRVTYPDGACLDKDLVSDGGKSTLTLSNLEKGDYKIMAIFDSSRFVSGSTATHHFSTTEYTFTVKEDIPILSADKDTVVVGEILTLSLAGRPKMTYTIDTGTYFEIVNTGIVTGNTITIPNPGNIQVQVKALGEGIGVISLSETDISISVAIVSPTISIDSPSAFAVGDTIKLSGISNAAGSHHLYIEGSGQNQGFSSIGDAIYPLNDCTWKATIEPSEIFGGNLPVGTYTLYLSTTSDATSKENLNYYSSTLIQIREPIFTFTDKPAVAVLGYPYEATGIAEVCDSLQVYILGDDFFSASRYNEYTVGDLNGNIISYADNEFVVDFTVGTAMETGDYTLIIQHPMNDGEFNVYADDTLNILKDGVVVCNGKDSTAIASLKEALSNAGESYITTTITVETLNFRINDLASEYSRGVKLPISGNTNLGEGILVTTTMSPAVSQYSTIVTKTHEDGSWELTYDTTRMAPGEYTLTIQIGISEQIIRTINIIDGEPGLSRTSIPLKTGWNFISFPKYLGTSYNTAKELFGNLNTGGYSILGYNGKTGWYTLEETTEIKPLEGYWVYANEPTTLTFTYSTEINTPPTKTVYKGWNAIGLSAETFMTAKSTFAGLNWERYLSWNIVTGNWREPIVNGGSATNSEENSIYLMEAGWLYLKEDGMYVGNTA